MHRMLRTEAKWRSGVPDPLSCGIRTSPVWCSAKRRAGRVCTWLPDRRPLDIGVVRRGVPSSSAVSSSASSSPATSTHASVSVARLNATRRLIDARSSVVEPLQPAAGGRRVGGRPRADNTGTSESRNLWAELGQLQPPKHCTITRSVSCLNESEKDTEGSPRPKVGQEVELTVVPATTQGTWKSWRSGRWKVTASDVSVPAGPKTTQPGPLERIQTNAAGIDCGSRYHHMAMPVRSGSGTGLPIQNAQAGPVSHGRLA